MSRGFKKKAMRPKKRFSLAPVGKAVETKRLPQGFKRLCKVIGCSLWASWKHQGATICQAHYQQLGGEV